MYRTKLAARVAAIGLLIAACGGASDQAATEASTAPEPTTAPSATSPEPSPGSTEPVQGGFPAAVAAANGEITIPARPAKIVSMSATHTEMLYAIGAGDQVVAVDATSNYPPEAPKTDLIGFAPNVEAIVQLGADLVVTDGDWDGTSMGALTELGVPVLILPAATTLEDVYEQLGQLGVATGHGDTAAAAVEQLREDIAGVLDSLPAGIPPLTFYHELDETFYSVTSGTFIGYIYNLMGLINIADAVGAASSTYPQLSEEYILEQDPDLIFLADTICCGVTGESLRNRPGWDTLTAVQTDAVVELNDDIASRWGPRIVDHMQVVATAIDTLAGS